MSEMIKKDVVDYINTLDKRIKRLEAGNKITAPSSTSTTKQDLTITGLARCRLRSPESSGPDR